MFNVILDYILRQLEITYDVDKLTNDEYANYNDILSRKSAQNIHSS